MIRITILGSGTCVPTPDRGNPGYLVEVGGHLMLLDCGSGALRQVARYGFDYRDIHQVALTHLHPDHTIDVIPLLFALCNDHRIATVQTLEIVAPTGFRAHFEQLREVYGHWIEESDMIDISIREIAAGGTIDYPFGQISTGATRHTDNSIGYRIIDHSGKSLVYSGDTGYSEEFAAFAKGTELLIIESAIPEGDEYEKHCTPSQAARMAQLAGAETTILTHFYPETEAAGNISEIIRQYYHNPLLIASDGMQYTIGGALDDE